ncbi:hypothetical protein G5I_13460 [Acromyrmex echinatior]|uniref:Uncharacterized protein n=1 Tax=Acromyrmex echinatior TaxID=103372 RepID=F4X549_ACREC|nr:hypothetical protein G5I_13460 [Acromyrmex echinatior]
MTRTEEERQEGRPPAKKVPRFRTNLHLLYTIMHALGVLRLQPDFRLQSNKDGLLLYERGLMTNIHFVAEGDNATFNVVSLAPTLEVSTPMAVKSNEGRGRTGSLSGRARSLLPIGASRGPLGPTLHRLVRLILSGKQTSGSREVRCE